MVGAELHDEPGAQRVDQPEGERSVLMPSRRHKMLRHPQGALRKKLINDRPTARRRGGAPADRRALLIRKGAKMGSGLSRQSFDPDRLMRSGRISAFNTPVQPS